MSYTHSSAALQICSSQDKTLSCKPRRGAGKIHAALLPFIEARKRWLDFPPHCIYSVPIRVLANQFAASELGQQHCATIQNGEHENGPEFGSDLTFATIDQMLGSFVMMPYSLSRRQANLNAGAIASSYLAFDGFHLFGPETMLPTSLEMLRILRGVTPFLLVRRWLERLEKGAADDAAVWELNDAAPEAAEQPAWDIRPIGDPKDAQGALAIIVHPTLARYDATLGFWPNEGGAFGALAAPNRQRITVRCRQAERALADMGA